MRTLSCELNTNIAILGGGPAGYAAAIRSSQLGADTVMIEEKELGGVCLNRGCIPTKSLLKTSEVSYLIKKSKEFGIESNIKEINWKAVNDRKDKVVKNLKIGLEQIIRSNNIKVLYGTGVIKNPNTMTVFTNEGEVIVNYKKLIIATGSEPLIPKIRGIKLNGVITSDEVLQLDKAPKSLIVIGAGAIGLEFASIFNGVDTKVTIIEEKDKILSQEDEEISVELFKILKRRGITFKLLSKVKEIKENTEGLSVIVHKEGEETTVVGDKILIAIGRKLISGSNEFESLGLHIRDGAIVVNEKMETSINGIYAAGDVIGGKLLAHIAFAEGKAAAENALGLYKRIDYSIVPTCVYTNPEVSSVGMNKEEADRLGIEVSIGRFYFRSNGRAASLGEREGLVKIIIDKKTNIIIGGQILGTHASEMISEVTLAVMLRAKADVISDMIHPHPTLSEAIWEACSDAIGRSIHTI